MTADCFAVCARADDTLAFEATIQTRRGGRGRSPLLEGQGALPEKALVAEGPPFGAVILRQPETARCPAEPAHQGPAGQERASLKTPRGMQCLLDAYRRKLPAGSLGVGPGAGWKLGSPDYQALEVSKARARAACRSGSLPALRASKSCMT